MIEGLREKLCASEPSPPVIANKCVLPTVGSLHLLGFTQFAWTIDLGNSCTRTQYTLKEGKSIVDPKNTSHNVITLRKERTEYIGIRGTIIIIIQTTHSFNALFLICISYMYIVPYLGLGVRPSSCPSVYACVWIWARFFPENTAIRCRCEWGDSTHSIYI